MSIHSTKLPGFVIRKAQAEDTSQILRFICDLAEYENLSHEVVASEEELRQHLFGDRPMAEVLMGEQAGRPVGFALYFHNFSTFLGRPGIYLEDLFVNPDDRGHGYGKALLTCLARIAVERNCGRLEWSVLDWNQPAIDFYQSLGAATMTGWDINRVTGPQLTEMASQFPGD